MITHHSWFMCSSSYSILSIETVWKTNCNTQTGWHGVIKTRWKICKQQAKWVTAWAISPWRKSRREENTHAENRDKWYLFYEKQTVSWHWHWILVYYEFLRWVELSQTTYCYWTNWSKIVFKVTSPTIRLACIIQRFCESVWTGNLHKTFQFLVHPCRVNVA